MGADPPVTLRQLEALRKDLEGVRNNLERQFIKPLWIDVEALKTSVQSLQERLLRLERVVAGLQRGAPRT